MTLRALRIATSILFAMVGILMSVWAAIAPFAKNRIDAGDSIFGFVILCMGIGSIVSMQLTAQLLHRLSEKSIARMAVIALLLCAPLLALVTHAILLAATLFTFGAAIGALEILMNQQASMLETKANRPIMSGFHAWFSVGGFVGALSTGWLLELSLSPLLVVCLLLVLTISPFFWAQKIFESVPNASNRSEEHPGRWFVWPKGSVAIGAILCFIVFLAEGAVLDWSAIFLVQSGKLSPERASFGYASFSAAMLLFRFTGDEIVKYLGRPLVLKAGSLVAALGLFMTAFSPNAWLALMGFALIGVGASNIVPILFSSVSQQRQMPLASALTAMTTFGYAGILLGPAFIGWISERLGMANALAFVGILLIAVALLGTKLPLPYARSTKIPVP